MLLIFLEGYHFIMGMLKNPPAAFSRFCRAHVLRVRSARQAYSAEVSYEGREGLRPCWMTFSEHSLSLIWGAALEYLWPMDMKYSTGASSHEGIGKEIRFAHNKKA